MVILLLKVAITVTVVSVLSLVAERVSPRAAGILSGYPLGSAISLFFIGVEQGASFAGQSAIYNAAGLCALLTFVYLYYQSSKRLVRLERRAGGPAAARVSPAALAAIGLSFLAGLAGFFAVNAALQQMRLSPWGCAAVAAGSIAGFRALMRKIPDTAIRQRVALTRWQAAFRAGVAALVILSVTGAAYSLPPSWAGLLSAFPATVFPLVLILHATYGAQQAHTVIKNLPNGLWSLMLYSITIFFAYPRLGIYWGTLVGFAAATLYLLAFAAASARLQNHRAGSPAGALSGSKPAD